MFPVAVEANDVFCVTDVKSPLGSTATSCEATSTRRLLSALR